MKKLYTAVTADKYELPVAVEESPSVLAKNIGVRVETIYRAVCVGYAEVNRTKIGYRFRKVMVEEE